MKVVNLGIQFSFLLWFIWSTFATSVDAVQKGYAYVDYAILGIILIGLFYNIDKLKFRRITIGLIFLLLVGIGANLNLGLPIVATHLKYLLYFTILSVCEARFSYFKIWNYSWILYPVLILYLFGWNKPARPFIFYENNFELLTLILVFAPGIILKYPKRIRVSILLALIILKSGSLSALSAYSTLIFLSLNLRYRLIFTGAMIPVLGLLISQKSGTTIMDIDRIVFAKIAFETFNDFTLLKQFISFEIPRVAQRWNDYLNYYQLDFSGINFPVSLHAFHLRILLINGLIGSILTYWVLYKAPNIINELKKPVFIILFVAGFSISSYNNLFVFLGMYYVIRYSVYNNEFMSNS